MNIMNSFAKKINSLSLSLFVACVYLFLYIPIFILVIFSFNSAQFPSPWVGFSLHWYRELFSSWDIWHAFFNSIFISLTATALSLLMGLGLVYYSSINGEFKKLLGLFYVNSIVPEVVLAVGLLTLFSFFSISLGFVSLIIAHTVLALGYVVPLIYTRYNDLDKRVMEASSDLGATPTQTFFKIVLPLLMPALTGAGLLVFILSFDDFILSFFCAGSEAQTLSLYIYSMIRTGVSPVVNALSTILLAFSSLLVIILCSLNVRSKLF